MISYSVFDLADSIFNEEFQFETGQTEFYYLSGWLNNNVGILNVKINTNFYVESGIFQPSGQFNLEERSIYKQLYLRNFYEKKCRTVLRGADSSIDFITLKDGDSQITKSNKNELAKTYKSLANDARDELERLASNYNIYQAIPRQVAGYEGFVTGSGLYCY